MALRPVQFYRLAQNIARFSPPTRYTHFSLQAHPSFLYHNLSQPAIRHFSVMADHQQLNDKISKWVDAHFDEEVAFLQEVIRIPTDTPPGFNLLLQYCYWKNSALLNLCLIYISWYLKKGVILSRFRAFNLTFNEYFCYKVEFNMKC